MTPINLKNIKISGSFWLPIMERVRTEVIPYQWNALNDRVPDAEPSYCIRNFKAAVMRLHPELDYGIPRDTGHAGFVFQDSDLAKWIEAAAYTLVWQPDAALEALIDEAVSLVCSAQHEDGYINTYYTINGIEKRFTNLRDNHELYCFGHFLEAACAYFEATGKRALLDAMICYADCIEKHIGAEEGKLHGYPGHEIAEMALLRLYEISKNEAHLKLAAYFIDERGKSPLYFDEEGKRNNNDFYWKDSYFQNQYYQAGKPVHQQRAAEGHAVRAVYLYSGMADLARLSGDKALRETCEALFENIVHKQMYITGAVGQQSYGESFSFDYDLPNDTVYGETCAAIGLAFFARRMLRMSPKGVYADTLERVLYNGVISGMSLDGKSFFYVNPLEVLPEALLKDRRMRHVKGVRQKWFACACCPPNIARITASLGTYVHSVQVSSIWTHLYVEGEAVFSINGKKITLTTATRYPWDGGVDICFDVEDAASLDFDYNFRIPAWCASWTASINGEPASFPVVDGYAKVKRAWKSGDKLNLRFDMPVTIIEANPRVRQNAGKVAVIRGPLVYCLEEADNGAELWRIRLPLSAKMLCRHDGKLLGGITIIECKAKRALNWQETALYRPVSKEEYEDKTLRFIPYYGWANRNSAQNEGEMTVWVNKI